MSKHVLTELLLDEAGVDRISEQLQEWMTQAKVEKKNATRTRLAVENLLEDLCIHYDRKSIVTAEMKRRFGSMSFVLHYPGEAYHPGQEARGDEWTSAFLAQLGLTPTWRYRQGVNELVLKLPRNKLRSEIWLILAFFGAVALGLCRPLLPEGLAGFLSTYLFTYLSTIFMNLLGTFAGILVFLSVISGICGIGNVSDFSRMGKYLIGRNILASFLGAGLCAVLMIPCYSFQFGQAGGASQITAISDMIFAIIPTDPITPFQTGNTLQIVFMAVLIGATVVFLGSRAGTVRETLIQSNAVALRLIETVCKLLPIYIFSSLTLMFWENGMDIFRSIWKPLVLCMATSLLLGFLSLAAVSLRFRLPMVKLFRKVLPGYLIGLTTASSTAAFGTMLDENEHNLGIDPQLSNFGTPIEIILSASTMSSGFLAILYFLAEAGGVEVNLFWFITAWLLVTVISFALPPVSGGTLIGLSVILTQFRVSPSFLGMAGTLSLLGDFFMTSSRLVILQMELVLEAEHWKLLDLETLRA